MMNFGAPMLTDIGERHLSEMDAEMFNAHAVMYQETCMKVTQARTDWLMPYIGQYRDGVVPKPGDASWMGHLKAMIGRGDIYMVMVRTKSWAYTDREFARNRANIEDEGFVIADPIGYEDAVFQCTDPITMYRVFMTDTDMPSPIPSVEVKDLSGIVEFGTQAICKTVISLMMGIPIMRMPYNPHVNGLPPTLAILYNANPNEVCL